MGKNCKHCVRQSIWKEASLERLLDLSITCCCSTVWYSPIHLVLPDQCDLYQFWVAVTMGVSKPQLNPLFLSPLGHTCKQGLLHSLTPHYHPDAFFPTLPLVTSHKLEWWHHLNIAQFKSMVNYCHEAQKL